MRSSESDAASFRSVARNVERWFTAEQRDLPWRDAYEPWHVWVSEVMLQQTRMDVVLEYFPRFIARFPTIESLASARESDAVAMWSGLGYYRRARMLHRGARYVIEHFGGALPRAVAELRGIPGVGRYSAGSISSIAFGERAAIVDGNVARVVARLAMIAAPLRSTAFEKKAWAVSERLVAEARSPRNLNQGLMELGARVCTPRKPSCDACPISAHCKAFTRERTAAYPKSAAAVKAVEMHIPLYVFIDRQGRVLFRRGEGSLMKGMLHLPHGNDALYPAPVRITRPGPALGSVRHTITNRRITFEVYRPHIRAAGERSGEWLWVAPAELDRHPHPSYVRKALALAFC